MYRAYGLDRLAIRARVHPYASSDWAVLFPGYVVGLTRHLEDYQVILRDALNVHQVSLSSRDVPRLRAAFANASRAFSDQLQRGRLTPTVHAWHQSRLVVELYDVLLVAEPFAPSRAARPGSVLRGSGRDLVCPRLLVRALLC